MDARALRSVVRGPILRAAILRPAVLCVALALPPLCPRTVLAGAADDLYTQAADHYRLKQWKEAAAQFRLLAEGYPQHNRRADALFFRGEALMQLGQYAEAKTSFDALLKIDDQHRYAGRSLFCRGEASFLLGDKDAAREDFNRFGEQFGDDELNASVLSYLGELDLDAKRPADAEGHFSEALRRFADAPAADACRLGLARAAEQQGRLDEARKRYRDLAEQPAGSSSAEARFRLATLENTAGRYSAAVELLTGFDAAFPQNPLSEPAALAHGWALYKLGRHAAAARQFAAIPKDSSRRLEAQYWLGLSQKAQQHWSEAAETLLAAAGLADSPRLAAPLHFEAGDAWLQAEKFEPAVEQFDWVLKHDPDGDWADDSLYGKLQIAQHQTDAPAADRLTAEFLTRFPKSDLRASVQYGQAGALMAAGSFNAALEPLHVCLAAKLGDAKLADTQLAQCRAWLAVCHARLNQMNDARREWSTFCTQYPQSPLLLPTVQRLAEIAAEAKDRAWAAELYDLLAKDGNPAEFVARGLSGKAWLQLEASDLAASASTFEKLLERYPDDALAAEAALQRAAALEKLSRDDPALAMYLLVIEKYPSSKQVAQALYRAARLHEKLGQDRQAAELYEKLVNDHADFSEGPQALYQLGDVLVRLDRPADAEAAWKRLRKDFAKSNQWAAATFQLLRRAADAKHYDEAESFIEEMQQVTLPASLREQTLFLSGRVAASQSKWDQVRAPLEQLRKEFRGGSLALPAGYWIAEATYRGGRYEQAVEEFTALADEAAGHRESWLGIVPLRQAQSLAQLKRWPESLEIARGIAAAYPEFDQQYEVDYLIGRALAAQADFSAARESYIKVVRSAAAARRETAAMAQWMIGETYFHQRDFEPARREYLRVESEHAFPRWQSAALLQAGKCCESAGQCRSAIELYERLLKNYPGGEFEAEAARRLEAARLQLKNSS